MSPDPHVARLAALFTGHPVWQRAAAHVREGATSNVYFHHRPGRVWHLVRRAGRTVLARGPAADPDFVFRFSPWAIERLAAVRGDVGEFAVELFERILDADESHAVNFRIVAPFRRLLRHGYLRLLLAAGPSVLAFGATHGIRTISGLRSLVDGMSSRGPADWEIVTAGSGPAPGNAGSPGPPRSPTRS